jgi:hypothetical protein
VEDGHRAPPEGAVVSSAVTDRALKDAVSDYSAPSTTLISSSVNPYSFM